MDKVHTAPRLSLINVPALNYLLRSEIYVSEDGQLRSVPLILGYTPKEADVQPTGNAITQGDYRLQRIDVARKNFLAPYDLAPVPHPNPQVPEDSSEEEMSDLRLLLKRRSNKVEVKGTGTSRPVANLPPPPPAPQVPDPALKPIPDLKKKRPMELEDKEKGLPPKTKQQKVVKEPRQKRGSSVESREEPPLAERDLAMITQQVFVGEEWNRKTHVEAQAEAQARSEAERALDSLKAEISKLSEQLKGVAQERDSLDAERENIKELRAELLKAKKATEEAQRDAQLAKEATEAEKRASYQLGVETTEKGLTEQFASVARDYCDLT
nr:coiled-coil domain-containing protein 181-like [Quercus suber]